MSNEIAIVRYRQFKTDERLDPANSDIIFKQGMEGFYYLMALSPKVFDQFYNAVRNTAGIHASENEKIRRWKSKTTGTYSCFGAFISGGFVWIDSPQGHQYWEDIACLPNTYEDVNEYLSSLMDDLSESDFEE